MLPESFISHGQPQKAQAVNGPEESFQIKT